MIERYAQSLEYIEAEAAGSTPGGQPIDPATLTIQLAFTAVGAEPLEVDWHPATFLRETPSPDNGRTRPGVFGVLAGPGALDVPHGDYDAWIDILDNPERPRAPFGKLRML
ncbi:hypothetical protein [Amycolatopsis sp. NPDC049159]|uniref:hypothetical protein n=1 Tax=Amycolatopsis sp. NPDC049159 TaxID=3157210 RepID=UPI0033C71C81